MKPEKSRITVGKIIFTAVYILIFPALVFFLSGDWSWIEAWIFDGWFIALCAAAIVYLYRRDPALLAERYKQPGTGNQKGWDKYVVYGILLGFILWIVIMPLDARRFGWTPRFPIWLKIMGGIGLLASSFLIFRAYTDNPFLSPLVRIQSERNHQVVSSGVYKWVRHPMYLGALLLFMGTPLLLGSNYGILVGLLISLLIIARIIREEKMLVQELAGYAEYRKKVKFRLIPFVW